MPTSAKEWKKSNEGVDLLLPSGNICLARRRGMQAFVQQGIIPNGLMAIIQEQIDTAEDKPKKDLSKEIQTMASDQEKLREILEMADAVTVLTVLNPPVHSDKWTQEDALRGDCEKPEVGSLIPLNLRDEEFIYVDEIDEQDKMFIFAWSVGGTSDLERFREEQAAVMGDVSVGEALADSSKPSA